MKRDMDLIREILLTMERHEYGNAPDILEVEGYTEEQIGYHCYLLNDAGLINAADVTDASSTSPSAIPFNLKWNGHEFIANAQNENIWGQAKEAVAKLGDASFSIWSSVLVEVVKRNLGINS
jgi:hypothetical protein